MAEEVDLLDGVADGKLDPATLRPPQEAEPEDDLPPGEFLRRLEDES